MSQGRRARDFSKRRDAQVRELRRGDGVPTVVAGYLPGGGGRPRPHPGDEKFPFVKDVPDVEGPVRYIEPALFTDDTIDNPIPLVGAQADYLTLAAIDTGGIRLLTLFIEYFPGTIASILSILPQGELDDDSDEWFPFGVVDGAIVASTTVDCGGARKTFATELQFDAAGIVVPASCREALVFDVSTHRDVRFLVGDTVSALSGLNLHYTLMR